MGNGQPHADKKLSNVIISDEYLYFYRQYSSEERASSQAYRNVEAIQKYVCYKNIEIYAEYFWFSYYAIPLGNETITSVVEENHGFSSESI